jgi:hypothetical protein
MCPVSTTIGIGWWFFAKFIVHGAHATSGKAVCHCDDKPRTTIDSAEGQRHRPNAEQQASRIS